MRITINVTKRDITEGNEMDCPVTRALRRALGVRKNSRLGDSLRVGSLTIYYLVEDEWDEIDLATMPKIAQDFVRDFDRNRTVKPFSFPANFNQVRAKSIGLTLPTV
ncbi:hypothetical protein LCGC14_2039660 [marine sediment metagenome]|uniref:Uncharacterized protein n=1 Tax=marine sediment metagenome TaxID=412755 RepID=A0A0F9ESH1_9ZZZZ